jgi:HK97 gp10 family phage protein
VSVIRVRRPIGRQRSARFGGGAGGSEFAGQVFLNTSKLDELANIPTSAFEGILKAQGEKILDIARPNVPVDTGELVGSGYVTVEERVGGLDMRVGYSADHAAVNEFGSSGRVAKPFLRPAWEEHVASGNCAREIKEGVQEVLNK